MKKIDEDENKMQRLKIFNFDLNNIKDFTIDHFFKILENNGFSLRFSVSEQEFLKHLKSIGFKKTKDPMFDLEFKQDEVFIKLTYSMLGVTKGNLYIKKILTNDKNLEFNCDGNLLKKHYNKHITPDLFEKFARFNYATIIDNSKKNKSKKNKSIKDEFVSSITYIYDDNRKNKIENLKLHSIVEYPIEVDNFTVSVFDPIYYNYISNHFFKTSQLLLNFNGKDLKLFNPSSEHRYNLIDFNQIFSKKEIELLKIIMFQ